MRARATLWPMRAGFEVRAESCWILCGQGLNRAGNPRAGWLPDDPACDRAVLPGALARTHRIHHHGSRNLAHRAAQHVVLADHAGGRCALPGGFLPGAASVRFAAAVVLCGFHSLWMVALVA